VQILNSGVLMHFQWVVVNVKYGVPLCVAGEVSLWQDRTDRRYVEASFRVKTDSRADAPTQALQRCAGA
jgi:hypothetical protein